MISLTGLRYKNIFSYSKVVNAIHYLVQVNLRMEATWHSETLVSHHISTGVINKKIAT